MGPRSARLRFFCSSLPSESKQPTSRSNGLLNVTPYSPITLFFSHPLPYHATNHLGPSWSRQRSAQPNVQFSSVLVILPFHLPCESVTEKYQRVLPVIMMHSVVVATSFLGNGVTCRPGGRKGAWPTVERKDEFQSRTFELLDIVVVNGQLTLPCLDVPFKTRSGVPVTRLDPVKSQDFACTCDMVSRSRKAARSLLFS